jgi:hypothetical protein
MAAKRKNEIPGTSERSLEAPAGVPAVAVPRRWLTTVTTFVIVPWLIIAATVLWYFRQTPAAEPTAEAPWTAGQPGPWGRLVTLPIAVSPPPEYIQGKDWTGAPPPAMWFFPAMTGDQLEARLVSYGLSRADAARLRATARSASPYNGLFVMPDDAFVRQMNSDVRAKLYLDLAKFGALSGGALNQAQAAAFRFYGTSLNEWLRPGLSAETRQLVEPLIYRHEGFLTFADIDRIVPLIEDKNELQLLVKRLMRQNTLLVRLRVDDPSKIETIADYWGRGGRRTDLEPLLESVVSVGGESQKTGLIDIVHLLPPLARQNLLRYPRPTIKDLENSVLANCLWTALNFFNEVPDDKYLDPAVAMERLKTDYYLVYDNYQLGDIVAFTDEEGQIVHVAVYLADDLLFSKNGMTPLTPWTIMPFDRFKGLYPGYSDTWRITRHRLKGV